VRPCRAGLLQAASGPCLVAALVLTSQSALADLTKDQCIEANTQAQSLRREGKLAAARAQLVRCGDPSCPAMLRDDCTQRTDELERAQPTILFDAKDGAGHDLIEVKVTVDGQPLADRLEGRALRVDPGAHSFVLTAAGQPPVTETFVLKEGEKDRRERIVIGAPVAVPAAPPAATPFAETSTPSASAPSGLGTTKILGLAIGGAGVAGLAVGSVFGLLTASAASQQKTDCASATICPRYPQAASDHSTAQTDGAISTVAFIAGGALLAGGAVLFLAGGRSSEPSTGLVVVPGVAPGGGALLIRGAF